MNSIPGFGPNDKKRQELLAEILMLRETDYDAFMERMFDALNTVFQDSVKDPNSRQEKLKSIDTMIQYFSDGDAYEKCQRLLEIKKHINEYHDQQEKVA